MKKILIPVDFSDHTAPTYKFAIKIGGDTDKIELTLLHSYNDQIIIPDPGLSMGLDNESYISVELIEEFKKVADANIDKLKTEIIEYLSSQKLNNYTINTIVEGGDPSWEISNTCSEVKPDLVIIGMQGAGKKGFLDGNMANKIMSKAKLPVLAVPYDWTIDSTLKMMYPSSNPENDYHKIRELFNIFKKLSIKIFAVHFILSGSDIGYDSVDFEKEFSKEIDENTFQYSLVKTDNKNETLKSFVADNNINIIGFTAHKTNFFSSLFKHGLSKHDFFMLNLPMVAVHEQ